MIYGAIAVAKFHGGRDILSQGVRLTVLRCLYAVKGRVPVERRMAVRYLFRVVGLERLRSRSLHGGPSILVLFSRLRVELRNFALALPRLEAPKCVCAIEPITAPSRLAGFYPTCTRSAPQVLLAYELGQFEP